MRSAARARALLVIATSTAAAVVAGTAASGVVGHGPPAVAALSSNGTGFAASPNQGRVGKLPSTIFARSKSRGTCPAGSTGVLVRLMDGETKKSSAVGLTDAEGKWSVAVSVPPNLRVGSYALTAACYVTADPGPEDPAIKTYRPQTFRVVRPEPPCPSTTRDRNGNNGCITVRTSLFPKPK